eukprot:CAMPEP_0118701036 /NCGR_PEP_ID=MMETSP0800-20121206/16987_1 /TAXON_ID=210618 ORGANISM="Striatella unipunctata, Strain CCMP2910" /NCGR_SAMPLE_ID=MMETSP0800 /ASSEMBLY_ACC=CAM_ASM_000638 /LENGTH=30 /DNA_ID= /DNA_START= /DNA_END= /DNA_ORIENTATION=
MEALFGMMGSLWSAGVIPTTAMPDAFGRKK